MNYTNFEEFMSMVLFKEYEFSNVRLLEIGLNMRNWNNVFNKIDHIYGIGYNNKQTHYMELVDDQTTLFMGKRSDILFLENFIYDSGGNFDIILDDGSHVPSHIQTCFEMLWKHVKQGGVYIIEDVKTSYWNKSASIHGYSLNKEGSIVEYFKSKVYEVNNECTSDVAMISFVQNMIIIHKK